MTTTNNTNVGTANIDNLVSTVRTESARWVNDHTPADLLGALLAANALDSRSGTSAGKLGWYCRHYKLAAAYLMSLGLAESIPRAHVDEHGNTTMRNHGLWLTPLGWEVAETGSFTDTRTLPPTTEKKRKKSMLRANKNPPKTSVSSAAGETALLAALRELTEVNRELTARITRIENTVNAPPAPASTPRPVAYGKCLSFDQTFSHLMGHNVTGLINSIVSLADGSEHPDDINVINVDSVYKVLTEYECVIESIKKYLSGYFTDAGNGPLNIEELIDYCDHLVVVAGDLKKYNRQMPLISVGERAAKRETRKEEKITRVPWTRTASVGV